MKTLNLNQRKLISEGLINLSVAFISIGIITPIFSKTEIGVSILIKIILLTILTIAIIYYSVKLIR